MLLAGLLALAVLAWGGGETMSGWATGTVRNSADSAATGTLAFSHVYGSGGCSAGPSVTAAKACAGQLTPTAVTPSSGTTSAGDSITNNGTLRSASLTQQLSAASCAPVQFANSKNGGNPLLVRYGTAFSASGGPMGGAGYATFDGGAPGGYATAIAQQTQPTGPSGLLDLTTTSTYGLGIWFRTATAGPLFEIGSSPSNAAATDDRILWVDGTGKMHLIYNQAGNAVAQTATTNYADDGWHFAYVVLSNSVVGVNVLGAKVIVSATSTETVYVDGAQVASGSQSVSVSTVASSFNATTGYWHAGWAPVAKTGLGTAYFKGSLSNFLVWDTPNAPGAPTAANLATQSSFSAWAGSPTEWWPLNDPGTTTYTGSALPASMSAPCSQVTIAVAFSSPTDSVPTQTLSAFANGVARTVVAPDPATTQTMTTSVGRAASYNGDIGGLHLYVPLSIVETTKPASSAWTLTFRWADPTMAVIA